MSVTDPCDKHPEWMDSGHDWIKSEFADRADFFAYEANGGYCNGPVCKRCGYGACWHCVKTPPPCKP